MTIKQIIESDIRTDIPHWKTLAQKPNTTERVEVFVPELDENSILEGVFLYKVFDWDETWVVTKSGKKYWGANVVYWKYKVKGQSVTVSHNQGEVPGEPTNVTFVTS